MHAAHKEPPAPPAPPQTIASVAPGPRRTIASYRDYAQAEAAVDWLADQGFAVERGAIVGVGLRSVERVAGRMTAARAALVGAAGGIFIGPLLALLAGSAVIVAYAVVAGALCGALVHFWRSGGRRFISATRIEAERYDVQIDESAADDAARLLAAMPAEQ